MLLVNQDTKANSPVVVPVPPPDDHQEIPQTDTIMKTELPLPTPMSHLKTTIEDELQR